MQCRIQITGTKPIWFGERKVLPGETAVVEETQINRKNRHIHILKEVKKPKKQIKRRKKKNGTMESKRSDS